MEGKALSLVDLAPEEHIRLQGNMQVTELYVCLSEKAIRHLDEAEYHGPDAQVKPIVIQSLRDVFNALHQMIASQTGIHMQWTVEQGDSVSAHYGIDAAQWRKFQSCCNAVDESKSKQQGGN